MAGIYIHIPYCRQACRYCDFHFKVSVWNKRELIPYILKEIESRADYLGKEPVDTIYFGGGTPSVLEKGETEDILACLYENFTVSGGVEVSFEANPEDLEREYLKDLHEAGINRLSIGVQSFYDQDLELMHRIHNGAKAIRAIQDTKAEGFDNITIDLIYGIPRQEPGVWERNLETLFSMGIQHFSAYHLTYESGTIFDHWKKKGRIKSISEEESLQQFNYLIDKSMQAGFEHYEISNFATPGFRSRHNMNYWQRAKYLGIGPSAHSYNHQSRRWNISNHEKYIHGLSTGVEYFETEELTEDNKYNEFVMTGLRLMQGISILQLQEYFGDKRAEYFVQKIEKFAKNEEVLISNGNYKLSKKGIFIADFIIESIFV